MTVEANLILQRHHAAVILAREAAIKAVRQQRKRQGIKHSINLSARASNISGTRYPNRARWQC
jgi:hypothetical protein